ncbi:MAG: hypothetical protein AAB535_04195 [Patescibacteria group bacterium]
MGKDAKVILGVIILTIVIIVGDIFLSTKNQNKPTPTSNPF